MKVIRTLIVVLFIGITNMTAIYATDNICNENITKTDKKEKENKKKEKIKVPSAKKIAKDLKGVKFKERDKNGYFSTTNWEIADVDEIEVSIKNLKKEKNTLFYKIKIEQTFPSRGCYILEGEAAYVWHKNKWVQDYFVCDRILPKVTHKYENFISTKIKGNRGQRSLEIENHSNVTLAVLGYIMYEYSGERKRFAVSVKPNETTSIGGIFIGSITEYGIHYVELR